MSKPEFNLSTWAEQEEIRSHCETCQYTNPEFHAAVAEFVRLKKTGKYPHVSVTAFHTQLVEHYKYPFMVRALAKHLRHVKP